MDFEKLGVFYLGKSYDLANQKLLDRLLMYDARDLTTHAVCVGMTGSGKTGLCLSLLEEAAIDHVPAIIIDPKGDIANLLLTFPELRPEDFRPWVNVDDARRAGLTVDAFAAEQAGQWREGLARWGQEGERIRMLRESTDFVVYTPGSDAGEPVSIMQSFAAPAMDWDTEAELLRERIQGIVSALLGLVGVEADPIRSREHILLANVFEHFWRQGEDLDLPKLIMSIQKPPLRKLGVFDVDTFFPEKDRFELAMTLNGLIATPAFKSWLAGQPMDIPHFLSSPEGKPRHAIFYIAHLSEPERMFFVTMLLNHLVGWMRGQPGTTSLRALLYIDEVFGYLPPVANPPSKKPLLTLLKQARAFGLGTVLTTQNPADLDYKGLTNAGTWFIGRLQAERDKERLLDGLESVSSNAGAALDRGELAQTISGLGKRVFLLHNVHEAAPEVFHTRWALSYLRGPLTRPQVRDLMAQRTVEPRGAPQAAESAPQAVAPPPAPAPPQSPPAVPLPPGVSSAADATLPFSKNPPSLSAQVQQIYLPLRKGATTAEQEIVTRGAGPVEVRSRHVVYVPALLGMGRVHFVKQTKAVQVTEEESFALLAQPPRGIGVLRWEQAQALDLQPQVLLDRPEPGALFDELPESLNESQEHTAHRRDLEDHLYRTRVLNLWHSPAVGLYSQPGEDERAFQMRVNQTAREQRDAEVDALEAKYQSKLKRLEDRLRSAQMAVEKKEAQARTRKQDALLTAGETVLGLFAGRRRSIATAARRLGRSGTAQIDVDAAVEKVDALQADIEALQSELKRETEAIVATWEKAQEALETIPITPRRADIEVTLFALAWVPHWYVVYQIGAVVQTAMVGAY